MDTPCIISALAELTNADVRRHAEIYRQHGLAIVRVRPGEKRPGIPGWQLQSLEPSDFTSTDNIAILPGRLSGDLVAVDLDHPLALELADQYLPPTGMVEGRPGKPASHRYYRVTNLPPELTSTAADGMGGPRIGRFRVETADGECPMIVEMLGTGGECVAPPSLHTSGERRRWERFGAPTVLPAHDLYVAVARLAQAVAARLGGRVQCAAWAQPLLPSTCEPRGAAPPPVTPAVPTATAPSGPRRGLVRRAAAYIARIEPAVSGHGGHDRMFYAACRLVRDFGLTPDEARPILQEYNARCQPPWTKGELQHKLDDADHYDGPRGRLAAAQPPGLADDLAALARRYLEYANLEGRLRFWKQTWQRYDGRCYAEWADDDLRASLVAYLTAEAARLVAVSSRRQPRGRRSPQAKVNRTLVSDVSMHLQSLTKLADTVDMPSWIGAGPAPAEQLVALTNGLLDVTTGTRHDHTADWFSAVCSPYANDPAATCPRWLAALERTFAGDAECIALVQEWFGYNLLPTTTHQAFLLLTGEGANGKSMLCAALEAVLGSANVSAVPLEDFSGQFALTATLGKLANIVPEVGELERANEAKLKGFVSGDLMYFNRKCKPGFMAHPTARLTLATNHPPHFRDRSNGLWRRLLLLPCLVVIPPTEQVADMDKAFWWEASGELPGLLLWALEGRRRLVQQGRFTIPTAGRTAQEQVRMEASPARLFLTECCALQAGVRAESGTVYASYREWCVEQGHRFPLAAAEFGKEVHRVFPTTTKRRLRDGAGRSQVYEGLALTRPLAAPYYGAGRRPY